MAGSAHLLPRAEGGYCHDVFHVDGGERLKTPVMITRDNEHYLVTSNVKSKIKTEDREISLD
jgi:hypothetical protein